MVGSGNRPGFGIRAALRALAVSAQQGLIDAAGSCVAALRLPAWPAAAPSGGALPRIGHRLSSQYRGIVLQLRRRLYGAARASAARFATGNSRALVGFRAVDRQHPEHRKRPVVSVLLAALLDRRP